MVKNNKENKIPKNLEWLDLCAWIEKNIFGYDENQKLQKPACLVLKGLCKGQNVANNAHEQHGDYSYSVILTTFKYCKQDILNGIKGKTFESERNKMSYCCAIVRDKINMVYTNMENARKSKSKTESVNVDSVVHEGAEYESKTDDKAEHLNLEDLW